MALSKAFLILIFVALYALMGSTMAAEAPAPGPSSGAGSIAPSFVYVFAAALALLFGSALKF